MFAWGVREIGCGPDRADGQQNPPRAGKDLLLPQREEDNLRAGAPPPGEPARSPQSAAAAVEGKQKRGSGKAARAGGARFERDVALGLEEFEFSFCKLVLKKRLTFRFLRITVSRPLHQIWKFKFNNLSAFRVWSTYSHQLITSTRYLPSSWHRFWPRVNYCSTEISEKLVDQQSNSVSTIIFIDKVIIPFKSKSEMVHRSRQCNTNPRGLHGQIACVKSPFHIRHHQRPFI